MRIFTAIPLPDGVKQKVSEIIKGRLPVSYVNTTNLHITLNFFGELNDEQLDEVRKLFIVATADKKRFYIELDRLTKFRQQIHITVKPNGALNALQSEMERVFTVQGFSFYDRAYYPHVKLANLHMDHVMNPERKIERFPNAELKQLNFRASKIILYESKLLLHHSHHYPILEQALI